MLRILSPVISVEPELRWDYISPAVKEILGYEPEQFYEDPEFHLKIIHPDDLTKLSKINRSTGPDWPSSNYTV